MGYSVTRTIAALLCFTSASTFAATTTFKVVKNNPNNYGEESIQIKTDKGSLAIYAVNLDGSKIKTLTSLKKGECVSFSTPSKLVNSDGYYSIDEINSVKKIACSK